MNEVIALQKQFEAADAETGKPVTVVGVDVSSALSPRLIVLRAADGYVWPDVVDQVRDAEPEPA